MNPPPWEDQNKAPALTLAGAFVFTNLLGNPRFFALAKRHVSEHQQSQQDVLAPWKQEIRSKPRRRRLQWLELEGSESLGRLLEISPVRITLADFKAMGMDVATAERVMERYRDHDPEEVTIVIVKSERGIDIYEVSLE